MCWLHRFFAVLPSDGSSYTFELCELREISVAESDAVMLSDIQCKLFVFGACTRPHGFLFEERAP